MDRSTPSLTRSPVSSPNTCSPQSIALDYPSPEYVDSGYKVASLYNEGCDMGPHLESMPPLPPLVSMASTSWHGSTLVPASTSTSTSMPSIASAVYDPYPPYELSVPAPYGHGNMYQPHHHSPPPFHRMCSRSPEPASSYPPYPYSRRDAGHGRVKMEPAGGYHREGEVSEYPSPHSMHAAPVEVGGYYPASGSSAGYLSDVPPGTWLKSEFSTNDAAQMAPGGQMRPRYYAQAPRPFPGPSPGRRPRRLTTAPDSRHTCEVQGCGRMFKRNFNYKKHMETHDDNRERPYACPDCTKTFVRKTDMTRHERSVHLKERAFECQYENCHHRFARMDTLRRHMEHGCHKRNLQILECRPGKYTDDRGGRDGASATYLPPLVEPHPRHML